MTASADLLLCDGCKYNKIISDKFNYATLKIIKTGHLACHNHSFGKDITIRKLNVIRMQYRKKHIFDIYLIICSSNFNVHFTVAHCLTQMSRQ